jgi:hypothetical protein
MLSARARLERVGDGADRVVADAELVLVDEGVVDAVDHQLAQGAVGGGGVADVVAEAQRLEEVLVHDVRAGGDDRVDGVRADELEDRALLAGADQAAREREDDGAVLVGDHLVGDLGGAGEVARLEGGLAHHLDERDDVHAGDVEVLDGVLEEVLLFHGSS